MVRNSRLKIIMVLTDMQEGFAEVSKAFDQHGISCDVYYIDARLQTWLVPVELVYSRTPSDIEYKLPATSLLLGDVHALAEHLRSAVDVAFPVLHGSFGEDGELGSILRDASVPYVGSSPEASGVAFNKVWRLLSLLRVCMLCC
jgi:D-alanine-D-alanine ligase-like ATP-grasp enzyme